MGSYGGEQGLRILDILVDPGSMKQTANSEDEDEDEEPFVLVININNQNFSLASWSVNKQE